MNAVQKLIVALSDPDPAARDAFGAWARAGAAHEQVARAELEVVDLEAHTAHTPKPVRWFAFASLWAPAGHLAQVRAAAPHGTDWFVARDRLAFDRSGRADEARPWAGVKKTTPWAPVAGVEQALWQARYTNHGVLTAAYHATAVRYRQNVVLDSNVPGVGGVSELWWTNAEDLVERFYDSPDARRLVGYDTVGFVDATRADPVVTRHEILRAAPVTDNRPFLPG
jgi:hypothetical protein